MAVQIQRRRGNTAQTAVFTGAFAESTIDTDKHVAVIHDGVTQGGFPGARESTLNIAFGLANTVLVTANHAYDTANAAFAAANAASGGGSVAFPQANTARDTANLAYNAANAAFNNSNVAGNFANTAATAAYASANAISATANTALTTANLAFNKANGAVQLGFTSVAANGNGVVITAASNSDTLIFANTGNITVTANAAGGKNLFIDLTTTGVAAGAYGNALFTPSFTVDSRGRIVTVTPVLHGDAIDAYNTANAAFINSNSAGNFANAAATAAYNSANAIGTAANSTLVIANNAYNTANAAFAKANIGSGSGITSVSANTPTGNTITPGTTLVLQNTGNIYVANSGSTNMAFELTTTGVTQGVYGSPTVIPIVTIDSRGRVVSIANVAASSGSGVAQFFANTPTSVSVSPGASGLVLANTANIYMANVGTTNIIFDLTTTGVSAGAYGNALFGATFTVDSRGRLVAAAPVLMGDAIDAYNTANAAFINSNSGANFANAAATAAYASANAISATANTALTTANLAFNKANGAVQLGFTAVAANGNGVVISASSNSDTLIFANTGNITVTANAAGGKNLYIELTTTGVGAGVYGNALFTPQITIDSRGRIVLAAPILHGDAIDAYNTANSAFGNSNTAGNFANAAATAAYASANSIAGTANTALTTANLAYNKANAAVQLGFTSVAANGNGTTISAASNSDTLIFANTGNVVVTANAAGGKNLYIELTTTGVTAGAYGNALFTPSFTVDSRGRLVAASPVLSGDAIDAYNTANSAFGNSNTAGNFANAAATAAYASANAISATANTALTTANLAYGKANGAVQLGFTAVAANGNGATVSASSNNDTLIFANTGNVVVTANAAGGKNLYIEITTTGVTQGIYGSPTVIPIITVDSRGRLVSVSNVAASSGSGVAQFFANTPTSISISPGASGLVLQNTANIYVANTGTTNLYHELTTTGVTAGPYGNASVMATFTVDSRGRLVSAANVALNPAVTPVTIAGLSNTVTAIVSNAAATFMSYYIYNPNANVAYVQLFDRNTPGNVSLGVTAPIWSPGIPPGSAANLSKLNFPFANGIMVAATTTANGNTACILNIDTNFGRI